MAKLQLPEGLYSAQDVRATMLELQDYARWQAHNATKKQLGARVSGDAPQLSPAAHELLRQQPDIDALLAGLSQGMERAETISITLAAPASGNLKKSIVAWCRQNIAADALVNFDFSSTLLGGMVVRRGSHIYDWSFRRQIVAAQPKLVEVLRHV